eukprot:PhF_6_TR40494/c0_g3_i2/m.60575
MIVLLQILGVIIIAPSCTNTASIQQTITLPYSTQDRTIPSLFEFFRNISNTQLMVFGNAGDFRSFVVQEQIVPPPRGPYRGSIAFGNPYVAPNPPWNINITYVGNNTNKMTMIYAEKAKTDFDIATHRASQYMILNTTLWISGSAIGVFYIAFRVNFGEALYATSFETYVEIKTHLPRQDTIPLWSNCSSFTQASLTIKFTEWAYMHNETYLKLYLESQREEVADSTIVKERFRGWICLRYVSEVKDWVWSCGPASGLTVSDLGFVNWAVGEPRIQNSSGCVVLERDGRWTTDDCDRRSNGCVTFYTARLITSGQFIINVTSNNTNTTINEKLQDIKVSADTTKHGVSFDPAVNRSIRILQSDLDTNSFNGTYYYRVSGVYFNISLSNTTTTTLLCRSELDPSPCCEPIVFDSSPTSTVSRPYTMKYVKHSSSNRTLRYVTFPPGSSYREAQDVVTFVPCRDNNTVNYTVSWRLEYMDRPYYEPYDMYLTSLDPPPSNQRGNLTLPADGGRMSACTTSSSSSSSSSNGEYRTRVALSSPEVIEFVRSSGLSGWSCGRSDVDSGVWMWDCGVEPGED